MNDQISAHPHIEVILKVGGSLLAYPEELDEVARVLGETQTTTSPLLIVPGGGPFADSVREVDRAISLSDDAAHWMAILAMDHYALLLADRIRGAAITESLAESIAVATSGGVPILAPYRWLRSSDPLPHSWDVTSDSIALWIAIQCRAHTLALVKSSPAASRPFADAVDRFFDVLLSDHDQVMTWSGGRVGEPRPDVHLVSASGLAEILQPRRQYLRR